MIGISIETFDSILTRASDSKDSYNGNSKNLSNTMYDLENCYNGSILNFLFDRPISSLNHLSKIKEVLANNIDILENVKKSYVKQDEIFNQQLNHISSNLQ